MAHRETHQSRPTPPLPYQYLNVGLIHDVKKGNDASLATTDIIRQSPILTDTTGYELAVQRITVPIGSIPSFVAPLMVESEYADNQLIYSFTVEFGGFSSAQTFVTWLPQTTFWEQPTGIVQYSLQSDKIFYHAYNIASVFYMFNQTLQRALAGIGVHLPPDYDQISLYFNPTTQKPELFVPAAFAALNIYFNNQFAAVFSGWWYTTVAKNDPDGKDNLITIYQNPSSLSNGDITITPEVFNYNYLSPVQTIQVRSTLPIIYESTQPINVNYGQSAVIPNPNQSYPASQNILTDFAIDNSTVSAEGSYFVYNKTDSTRFISFAGGKTIQNFNISVYWTDNSNASWPMYLLPLTAINIKMIFIPCR